MIQEQILKLKEIVNQNDMGHLPLSYRVDLMKRIGNALVVQKILCECCKKTYLLWEKVNDEETPLFKILFDTDKYLYKGKGSAESIFISVKKWRNYAELSADEPEAVTDWAIIALGYAVRYDAAPILDIEDYCGEDDDAFDYESWNVDFLGSIAYSGSNPFNNTGDVEKRREYWLWYLNMVLAVYENPDKLYLKIKAPAKTVKPVTIPVRTQSWQVDDIANQLQELVNTLIREVDVQTKDWDKITLDYTLTIVAYTNVSYYRQGEVQRIRLCFDIHDYLVDNLNDIHSKMYIQAPEEGAWIQCYITINKDRSYDVLFNYDDITSISDICNSPDRLVGVFEDYPRSKEYTPQWYRDMIGKRKLYLD